MRTSAKPAAWPGRCSKPSAMTPKRFRLPRGRCFASPARPRWRRLSIAPLALNPNEAHAWLTRGHIHALPTPEAAIQTIDRARRLSPFDPHTFSTPLVSLSLISLPDASNRQSNGPTVRCTASRAWSQRCGSKLPRWRISVGSTRHAPNSVECLPSTQADHRPLSRPDETPGETARDQSGTLVTMIATEAEAIGKFVGDCISTPIVQAATLLSVLGYMLFTEPRLGLVVLLNAVPQVILVPMIQRRLNVFVRERVRTLCRAGDLTVDDLRTGHGSGNSTRGEVGKAFEAIYRVRLHVLKLKFGLKFLVGALESTGVFILLFAFCLPAGPWSSTESRKSALSWPSSADLVAS